MSLIWRLSWFFRSHWQRYSVAIFVLAIVAVIQTRIPALIGQMIDTVLQRQNTNLWSFFIPQLIQLLGMGVIVYILRYIWRVALYGAAYRLGHILRHRLYQHYLGMDAAFYQNQRSGKLIAHITNDIQAIETTAGEGILTLVDSVMIGCLVLSIMSTQYSWQLTIISLLPLPVMAFLVTKIGREIHHGFSQAQASFSDVNNVAHENISGLRTVRLFASEQSAEQQMQQAVTKASEANMRVAHADAQFDPVIYLCIGCAYLFALMGGSWLIHTGKLTIGELTSFSLYLGQLIWPMFAIAWLFNILERGNAAYHRIQDVLNMQSNITSGEYIAPQHISDIEFKHVNFDLTDQSIVSDISLQISAGSMTGIVGATGSGKTTFMRLLMRFIEPSHGVILVNGVVNTAWSIESLRSLFAYVPQEPYLFSMSVEENLRIGNLDAMQSQLEAAAKLAAIDEDISRFAHGYQTQIGEKGIMLSGGQRQRISIARALLSEKPILLLDDALSAVDSKTANRILKNLLEQKRMVIMVTHRLQGLENADQIVVMNHGQIIEAGNHRDLLTAQSWYAKTWAYQQIEQALDETQDD